MVNILLFIAGLMVAIPTLLIVTRYIGYLYYKRRFRIQLRKKRRAEFHARQELWNKAYDNSIEVLRKINTLGNQMNELHNEMQTEKEYVTKQFGIVADIFSMGNKISKYEKTLGKPKKSKSRKP